MTGETASADFPILHAAQGALAGGTDAFVAKLRADGTGIVYATYLGGTRDDTAAGVVVGADGDAIVVGSTHSPDFPSLDAFQPECGGCTAPAFFSDAFVSELTPDGDRLSSSTFLGGSAEDSALGVGLAQGGGAVVAGRTYSTNFPTTPEAYQAACTCAPGNALSAFVLRIGGREAVTPPSIDAAGILKRPFRIQISGTGFQSGAAVFIGDDVEPWPTALVTNANSIAVGGGKALKARFPKRVAVSIRVVNPDGGAASAELTR